MPKRKPKNEVLLYGDINSVSSANFIQNLNAVTDEVQVSVNTNGGDPQYGFGIIRSFNQFDGEKLVQIDGKAYSWGSFFPLYANYTVALDVSKFLFHRAAYSSWFEQSEYFTPELQADLKSVNDDLERAMRAKLDVDAFEAETGVTIKEIFSMDDRKDVYFNAKQALKWGLIDEIVKVTPKKSASVYSQAVEMAAKFEGIEVPPMETDGTEENANPSTPVDSNKNQIMTLDELKEKHPAVYKEAFNAGELHERDRAAAWAVFTKVDPEGVQKGIESGDPLKAAKMAEFTRKEALQLAGVKLEGENPKTVTTEKVDPDNTSDEKKAENALDAELTAMKPEGAK